MAPRKHDAAQQAAEAALARIEAKLGKVDDELVAARVVAERHSAILDEHMRRSEALEEAVALQRAELAPLKAHVALWGSLGKILSALGVVGGGVAALLKFLGVVG